MVTIRLSRGGAKKRPFYHLVIADKRSPRDGRFIEQVGFFNPVAQGQEERIRVDISRIEHWVAQGAQMSERVAYLVNEAKEGRFAARPKKVIVSKAKPKAEAKAEPIVTPAEEAVAEAEAEAPAEPVAEAAPEAEAKAEVPAEAEKPAEAAADAEKAPKE